MSNIVLNLDTFLFFEIFFLGFILLLFFNTFKILKRARSKVTF
jgi:hypothetical protein